MSTGPEVTAYAKDMVFNLKDQISLDQWEKRISEFFDIITDQCRQRKAIIGHIKGFLKFEDDGYAYFSNVGNRQGTHVDMAAQGDMSKATLTLNVVLYGLDREAVDKIVDKEFQVLKANLHR